MTRAEIDEILASPIPWADEADQKRCEVCMFFGDGIVSVLVSSCD